MNRRRRIGLLAVACAALGTWAALHFLLVRDDAATRAAIATRGGDSAPSIAPESVSASDAALTATRDALTPPAIPDVVVDPVDDDETGREAQLAGVVQDGSDRPIAGATIEVLLPPSREFSVLDLDRAHQADPLAELESDRAGRFAIRLERGRPVDLKVSADGFASRWVTNRYAGERLVVVLDQGCTLTGRLTRAADGTPVENVKLRTFRYGGPSTVSYTTTSDADGRYRFDELPADDMMLEVTPARERSPGWIHLEFGADHVLVKDFALEREIVVRGRVTDAKSGAPIPGAEVGEGWVFNKVTRADANGAYELHGFGSSGSYEVHARAKGYGTKGRTKLPEPVDGAIALDFAMAPARVVTGRVVDATHAAVEGAYVAAVASAMLLEGQLAEWPSSRTGADGRFEIANLTSELHHALFVQKRGAATVVYELPAAEFGTPSLDVGDVELSPPALLIGRVVDDKGVGIPNVETGLSGTNRDRYRLLDPRETQTSTIGFYVEGRHTRTDDRGGFSFADLPAGSFELTVRPSQRKEPPPVVVRIEPGEVKRGVVVTMVNGASIAGRVVTTAGTGVGSVYVVVESSDGGNTHVSTRSDREGRFEVRGLETGSYRVKAQYSSGDRTDERSKLLPAALEPIAAGTVDLDVVMSVGAPIRGIVTDADGHRIAHAWIHAQIDGQKQVWSGDCNGEGLFTVMVPEGAVVNLSVLLPHPGGFLRDVGVVASGIAAGASDVNLKATMPPDATPGNR
jgi:protocatechuate 3,4-dioxygenase beta subunit